MERQVRQGIGEEDHGLNRSGIVLLVSSIAKPVLGLLLGALDLLAVQPLPPLSPINSLPTRANLLPTRADLLPTRADSLPTQANLLPTRADLLSTQANLLPTRANLLPTQADLLSTRADLLPTRADLLSTRADLHPTRADLLPTRADLLPTRADLLPTRADLLPEIESSLASKAERLFIALPHPHEQLHSPRRHTGHPPPAHRQSDDDRLEHPPLAHSARVEHGHTASCHRLR